MECVFNPYLPLDEYVPDGEPHVFDGRLYIYGSHDRAQGTVYCEGDYVTWSAPVDNLADWRYEGVIYRKEQDPDNADGKMQLWAPDVTKGPDGRYYLYYCLNFHPKIAVAVSSSPKGPFSFYGYVKYPAHLLGGKTLEEHLPFDPAVLTDEDGRVYLYYGFAPGGEKHIDFPDPDSEPMKNIPEEAKAELRKMRSMVFSEGAMAAELEPDMITLKTEPSLMIPGEDRSEGTDFSGHGFFEASSIRKFKNRYYFVYSSHKSHDLCYAVSEKPTEGFRYGGILISNGDIGLNGRSKPVNVTGNNHGGLVQIGDSFYIFYHRQTHGTEFSRQGCAEKTQMLPDGSFLQVPVTSCGLNEGPLAASGIYPAAIACHITSPSMPDTICYPNPAYRQCTRIIQESGRQIVTDIGPGTKLGYKYFRFRGGEEVLAELKGTWKGRIRAFYDEEGTDTAGIKELDMRSDGFTLVPVATCGKREESSFYLCFEGEGRLEMSHLAFL